MTVAAIATALVAVAPAGAHTARTAAGAHTAGTAAGAAAAPAACTSSQLEIWIGDGPGGATAGTIYYPLEFSNISHRSCSLDGYPGLSEVNNNGKPIAQPARRVSGHYTPVSLAPGATAHAIFGVVDWGALCSKQVTASGIKVYAPNTKTAQTLDGFPYGACASKGVLVVEPVRAGVGIPGYTES
jgi:hypothetical protein